MVDRLLGDLRRGYALAGLSETVLQCVVNAYKEGTIDRYAYAWARYCRECNYDGLADQPSETLLADIDGAYDPDATSRIYVAKERYSIVALFPNHDGLLKSTRLKHWRTCILATLPKHAYFFDLQHIFQAEAAVPLNWDDEEAVRDRLSFCLSVFRLARAYDLAHIGRDFTIGDNGVAHTLWQRKGWQRHKQVAFFPNTVNRDFSIPALMLHYRDTLTADADRKPKPERPKYLFVASKSYRQGIRSVLSQDRLRNLRRDLLHKHGVDVKMFSSHSFRGAAVLLLGEYGVKNRDYQDDWRLVVLRYFPLLLLPDSHRH